MAITGLFIVSSDTPIYNYHVQYWTHLKSVLEVAAQKTTHSWNSDRKYWCICN